MSRRSPHGDPLADPGPLRVLYSFPHALGSSGIGFTAWNQVKGLADLGHEVTVVAASIAKPLPPQVEVITTLSVAGRRVPHRLFGHRDRALAWHDSRAARVLRARHDDFDVVHGWPLGSLKTLEAAAALGIAGVREAPNTHTENAYEVVARENERLGISLHDENPHHFNAERLETERREWGAATAVLVPSEAVAETFLARGFTPDRLIRHQYGALLGPAPTGPRDPDRPFTAAFVGRCEPRKGLHFALRAWLDSAASQTGRLIICGDFAPGYQELLANDLRHPSIEIRGFVKDTAVVYREADILLAPSIEEGSALVSYEAQANGCVPLVSHETGALLTDGVQGFVHSAGDISTLRRQIDMLAGDRRLLSSMRDADIAHRPALSWSAAAEVLATSYRTAMARHTSSPGTAGVTPRSARGFHGRPD
ncbi:glycosyltransferase family 4 protein [Amnibacterium flavum]|uniref:D-inositol 3-phosphate glycosyltransferase n=1 Tax=Amnibacterium flavum TaxID=2173173 RepID=A0A2V1HUD0_9MICO|nr:glycosyltransferase family 4 protein [Amnibacterium flavum]PVZ95911.1 group 1 glycosyl transferase [Amnibacterium flavum]